MRSALRLSTNLCSVVLRTGRVCSWFRVRSTTLAPISVVSGSGKLAGSTFSPQLKPPNTYSLFQSRGRQFWKLLPNHIRFDAFGSVRDGLNVARGLVGLG